MSTTSARRPAAGAGSLTATGASAVAALAALALALSPAASFAVDGTVPDQPGTPAQAAHPAATLTEPWRTVVGATWDTELAARWQLAHEATDDADGEPGSPQDGAGGVDEATRTALAQEVAARALVLRAGDAAALTVAAPHVPDPTGPGSDGTAPASPAPVSPAPVSSAPPTTTAGPTVTVLDPADVLPSLPDRLAGHGVTVMSEDAVPEDAGPGSPAILVLGPDAGSEALGDDQERSTATAPPVRELTAEQLAVIRDLATQRPLVVVLVDDGQLRTPWRDDVGAVLQAWSALEPDATAAAVADVLRGATTPTGRLPHALPVGEPEAAQGTGLGSLADAVAFEQVAVDDDGTLRVLVRNDGPTAVTDVVQAYAAPPVHGSPDLALDGLATPPAAEPVLVGWTAVVLAAATTTEVLVDLDPPQQTASGTATEHTWTVAVGRAADELLLTAEVPGATPRPDEAATPPSDGTAAPEPEEGAAPVQGPGTEAAAPHGTSSADATGDRPSGGPGEDGTTAPDARTATGSARVDLRATVPGPGTGPSALTLSVTPGAARLTAVAPGGPAEPFRLTGTLPDVTVHDARRHARGWSVSARADDLSGPTATIPAAALGWTPTAETTRRGLTLGPHVAGAHDGGPGLAEPALLATARGPARKGTTTLRADLELAVARETPPGSYAGTVTVTLFPVD